MSATIVLVSCAVLALVVMIALALRESRDKSSPDSHGGK